MGEGIKNGIKREREREREREKIGIKDETV